MSNYLSLKGTELSSFQIGGTSGAAIWSGAGVPDNSVGNNGDLYLSNGKSYVKEGGFWGAVSTSTDNQLAGIYPDDGVFIVGNGVVFEGLFNNDVRAKIGLGTQDAPLFSGLSSNGLDISIFNDLGTSILTVGEADSTTIISGNLIVNGSNISISSFLPKNVFYVSGDGIDDANSGTILKPFKTISGAIAAANSGDVIKIYPGIYTENLTINKNVWLIGEQTAGVFSPVIVDGLTHINGTESIKAANIRFRNPNNGTGDYALHVSQVGNAAGLKFENCSFTRIASDSALDAIKLDDSDGSWVGGIHFEDVPFLVGNLNQETGSIHIHNLRNASNGKLIVNGNGVQCYIDETYILQKVIHINGILYIGNTNIASDSLDLNNSIVSTAAGFSSALILKDVNLLQTNMSTIGRIEKTGNCVYAFNNVIRDTNSDIIVGSGIPQFKTLSDDILSNYAGTNYTGFALQTIKDHLSGIDTAIGNKLSIQNGNISYDSSDVGGVEFKKIISGVTTDDTLTELLSAGDQLVMPDNSTWFFDVKISGRRTDEDGEHGCYSFSGACDKLTGNNTITLTGASSIDEYESVGAGWTVSCSVDVVGGALQILVEGEPGKDVKWTGVVNIVESKN